MQNLNYFSLDLRKILQYTKTGIPPFSFPDEAEEVLMLFEIDEKNGKSIEPDTADLLGSPLWVGVMKKDGSGGASLELPLGKYFFAQVREILDEKGCTELVVEVQKEGLWERKILGNKVYLRYLYEHGSPVTQAFRELLESPE